LVSQTIVNYIHGPLDHVSKLGCYLEFLQEPFHSLWC